MLCFALGTAGGFFWLSPKIAQNAYSILKRKSVFLMYEAAAMPL